MTQKVLKVGSSAAVTISKKSLAELGLNIGDSVIVEVNRKRRVFSVRPSNKIAERQERIAYLTLNFVDRYRKDLQALAKK
ncbi:MAG: hypothetical protein HY434_02365 [Candidatus Liptonbacteria bacterium]|nr:hypothetical protein [Candidatus Liptonbacteria bacterium]